MCDELEHPADCAGAGRRKFLRGAGAATALGLVGGSLFSASVRADALTKAQRDTMTPEQIIEAMKNGNARFRRGERKDRNYLREQKASAKGQYPAAVLLTCIDSRAPAEVIMDLGIGDVFNCRVAGNIENDDILGSMEFACKLAGAKVVLVMGHTACGAVKGAIDNAFLRRLRFVVNFAFPDPPERVRIWDAVLPPQLPRDGIDLARLAQLNITGGNIRNIALHAGFIAADAGRAVTMADMLRATRMEYAKLELSLSDAEIAGWR